MRWQMKSCVYSIMGDVGISGIISGRSAEARRRIQALNSALKVVPPNSWGLTAFSRTTARMVCATGTKTSRAMPPSQIEDDAREGRCLEAHSAMHAYQQL